MNCCTPPPPWDRLVQTLFTGMSSCARGTVQGGGGGVHGGGRVLATAKRARERGYLCASNECTGLLAFFLVLWAAEDGLGHKNHQCTVEEHKEHHHLPPHRHAKAI